MFTTTLISGQTVIKPDTCIDMGYYKSYSTIKHDTLQVSYCTYKMYKPVKKVNRNGMFFHGDTKHFNYTKSGYDKGHLIPAEDMSFSKEAMVSSFVWWNCVPQTPKLNRGNWRIEELKWHRYADKDSVYIVVGACDFSNGIPKYCYKGVKSLGTGKVISVSIYTQDGNRIEDIPKVFYKKIMEILNSF